MLFIKFFLKLKKVLGMVFVLALYKPFFYLFKFFYKYGGKFFILKAYKPYRIVKKYFQEHFFSVKNKFLHIFGSRYLVHTIIIFIAIFVTTSNIKAYEKKGSLIKFDNKMLVGQLIKAGEFEGAEELIEENIDIGTISAKKRNYFYVEETKSSLVYSPQLDIDESVEALGIVVRGNGDTLRSTIIDTSETPKTRTEVEYYIVQSGDTVSAIAKKYNVTSNTIIWENKLNKYGFINLGQKLTILPTTGVVYKVKKYDTISKIANNYNVEESEIMEINKIASASSLQIGQSLIIPGGRKAYVAPKVTTAKVARSTKTTTYKASITSSDKFLWPASCRTITQYYHWRHHGVDIACKHGTPIYAVEDGTVSASGWSTGYGKRIIINHGNGTKTLYAHFTKLYVRAGQAVNRGDAIGAMGSTGWSTGSHLHFEVRKAGSKKNPLSYIR